MMSLPPCARTAVLAGLLANSGMVAAKTCPPPHYAGVNLSGGEFGPPGRGRYGTDYHYPGAEEAKPFLDAGMNALRLPIRWERVQPVRSGPLDPAEMARLDSSLASLSEFPLIILDLHDFGAYAGQRVDRLDHGLESFAALWTLLARHYRDNPRIGFGLMNEPNGISAPAWKVFAEAGLQAIRAAGATNPVLVPGTSWTGAHSWLAGGDQSNGAALAGFADPANNSLIEVHQYLDSDSSGTHPNCVSPKEASQRLAGFTQWLRANHQRGFLGEFGASASSECLRALDSMLDAIDASPDVWAGWTYWAAGGWWGNYPFSVQPSGNRRKPQMTVLLKHMAPCR